MIIEKIRLHPFAGITDRQTEFKKGLNIVLGPNEAGKSTILKALSMVLFKNINLTPSVFKNEVTDFLPLNGTDHIQIDLEMSNATSSYVLTKTWSAGKNRLVRWEEKGGKALTEEKIIEKEISDLLGINHAVYDKILFTNQAALTGTLNEINDNKNLQHSFSDLLRSAIVKQDGLSPDKLREQLDEKIAAYYNNWDKDSNAPEVNKAGSNVHKKNIGKILEAFYLYEEQKRRLENTLKLEKELDIIVSELNKKQKEFEEAETFRRKYAEQSDDIIKRQIISAELENIKMQYKRAEEAFEKWPSMEAVSAELDLRIKEYLQQLLVLSAEEQNALLHFKGESILNKYREASDLNAQLVKLESDLSNTKVISDDDFKVIAELVKSLDLNRVKLEAIKIKVSVEAKTFLKATLTTGDSKKREIILDAGKKEEEIIPGAFKFETDDIIVIVKSAREEDNIDKLMSFYKKGNDQLQQLLINQGVRDVSELEVSRRIFKERVAEIREKKAALNARLGKDTLEGLSLEVQKLKNTPSSRDLEVIKKESDILRQKIASAQTEIKNIKEKLALYIQEYSERSNLTKKLIDFNFQLANKEKQLLTLKSLPEGFLDAEQFIAKYKNNLQVYEYLQQEISSLQVRRVGIEVSADSMSAADINEEIEQSLNLLDKLKKEGEAYIKIKNTLTKILSGFNENTYQPYYESAAKYISLVTGGKYKSLDVKDGIVSEGISDGKNRIPVSLLSKGTADSIALAIRLSMAEFYLKDRDGFLILDDPLTDMDEERQKLAVACIKSFAEKKQVILFTCHPHLADLLAGNRVMLNK